MIQTTMRSGARGRVTRGDQDESVERTSSVRSPVCDPDPPAWGRTSNAWWSPTLERLMISPSNHAAHSASIGAPVVPGRHWQCSNLSTVSPVCSPNSEASSDWSPPKKVERDPGHPLGDEVGVVDLGDTDEESRGLDTALRHEPGQAPADLAIGGSDRDHHQRVVGRAGEGIHGLGDRPLLVLGGRARTDWTRPGAGHGSHRPRFARG